ncbi:MAG: toprim domain-containing protein [Oligoflexia bacterium]|nr:toprim domain-containing protein [Oligoflexia bacterium]
MELIQDSVRFVPDLYYTDENQTSRIPSLVAKIVNLENEIIGIQRIYLDLEGNKANVSAVKKTLGTVKGGTVRIGELTEEDLVVGICEGIETGIAVNLATDMPIWCGVSASGMESSEIPLRVRKVYIWGDKDRSMRGEQAADKLAARLSARGVEVFVLLPPSEIPAGAKGVDWLDVFNSDRDALYSEAKTAKQWTSSYKLLPLNVKEDPRGPVSNRPEIDEHAWIGLVGKFVGIVGPNTEADLVALAVQFLTVFGNIVGRNCCLPIEGTRHHGNLFTVLVGPSANARKGTALGHVISLFQDIDPYWCKHCRKAGLTTGEGIVHAVRDSTVEVKKGKEVVVPGVEDKRLCVVESEFAAVLRASKRDSSILSTVIRQAWDGDSLSTLSKTAPETATDPHISIIGHITTRELSGLISTVDIHNGLANRFLWVFVERSKILPFGGSCDEDRLEDLKRELREVIEWLPSGASVTLSAKARDRWERVYPSLTSYPDLLYSSVLMRAAPQVLRLSMLYALLDKSTTIKLPHLEAGLAVWKYAEESCGVIFKDLDSGSNSEKSKERDRANETKLKVLSFIRSHLEGVTRTDISEMFKRNKKKEEIQRALEELMQEKLVYFETESSGGRDRQRWFIGSEEMRVAG